MNNQNDPLHVKWGPKMRGHVPTYGLTMHLKKKKKNI